MLNRIAIVLTLLLCATRAYTQPPPRDTARVFIAPGWNLISLPVAVSDQRVSMLFPSAHSKAFEYLRGYVPRDTIQPGVGYWLKFHAAETVRIVGSTILSDTITLQTGWHMIGSLGIPIRTSDITTTPPNIVSSQYFRFDPEVGYDVADSLLPGEGYWV